MVFTFPSFYLYRHKCFYSTLKKTEVDMLKAAKVVIKLGMSMPVLKEFTAQLQE